ncbi:polymorphic toxin type 43 domain-containing protein, partial [Ralstonia pseudosolanacearum]
AAGGLAGSVVAPLVGMGLYAGTSGTNSAIDAATVAIAAMAGGAIAHAIGGDTTAGASTAQNAAMNNWLDHRRPNAVVYSEQERRDNAAAACKNDPTQCDAANRWDVVSKQRNAELQAACANLSSDTCRSAMATAQAAGNYIVFAGGKVYAYGKEDPVARSLDPSPAAKTLDTMVGSPLAGIFGGIPYFKSNADPAAGYHFAQYGMALEGIGAGVLGLPTGPLAGPGWRATLESPNTLYVGSGASSALPTWTNVAGPYSAVGQGGGVATTVRAGPGYTAQDVLPRPAAPTFSGSGPVPGVIAITDSTSVGALKNYYPSGGGIEFVYDPTTNTFAVGAPKVGLFDGSPHQKLAQSIGANDQNIVGGTFSRAADGSIATTENSGHYGQNWTPQIANQFQKWLSDRVGVPVNHQPWGSK